MCVLFKSLKWFYNFHGKAKKSSINRGNLYSSPPIYFTSVPTFYGSDNYGFLKHSVSGEVDKTQKYPCITESPKSTEMSEVSCIKHRKHSDSFD